MKKNKRLIIGMSGASGIVYGIRLLEALKPLPIETHLVVTKAAQLTRAYETSISLDALKSLADVYHASSNIGASIASGSFKTEGMIVIPCSMKTLAEIACGIGHNLLSRAADVVLKERRRLVIVPREAPLNQIHLENMLTLTKMGGIIYPPVPAFYHKPETLEEVINETVGRVLSLFDIECGLLKPWQG